MVRADPTITAAEWDLRFTLTDAAWKKAAKGIVNRLDSVDVGNNDEVVFVLVSGVELGKTHPKSERENYHVHGCLILRSPITRDAALAFFEDEKSLVTDRYCVPRNGKGTYMGWILHHTKLKGKEHSRAFTSQFLYRCGDAPHDVQTFKAKKHILGAMKKYAPEQQQQVLDELSTWKLKASATSEASLAKKREREARYRATDQAKEKRVKYDKTRRWVQYQCLVDEWKHCDQHDTVNLVKYSKILDLEATRWIKELLVENNQQPVPRVVESDQEATEPDPEPEPESEQQRSEPGLTEAEVDVLTTEDIAPMVFQED